MDFPPGFLKKSFGALLPARLRIARAVHATRHALQPTSAPLSRQPGSFSVAGTIGGSSKPQKTKEADLLPKWQN